AYSSDFYSIQDSLSFYADITNNGADTLQGVQLKLLLAEQTETFILFEESTALDTLLPGATKRLRIPEKWRVSYDYKNYVVKYEVVDIYHEQADANPFDNSASYHFNLREAGGFFEPKAQKDDCEGFDVVGTEDLPEWQIGTVYYQPDDFSRILYTVEFSVATESEEESLNDFTGINLVVYEIEDSDFYENWSINSISSFVEQTEVVGFNSFDFPAGASSFDLFKVDVLNAVNLEPGIMLEEGKSYLVSIVFEGVEADLLQVVDTSQVYPQVANMVGFEEKWYLNPFGNNVSPVIRLGEGCNFTTEVQEPQDVGRLWLSPNPTNDVVRLNWDEMTSGELQLNIWSADGRQVLAAKCVTSDGGIEIDVSHLPKGIYHVRASTEDKAYVGKLVIK
ncbi:MAG: T9SS type A sorting domain-containing protein, partial [Saprospiraceae bacterium]|nr:T9SS type A sorting domain-containing protein [Saprospiraceae bacterium]